MENLNFEEILKQAEQGIAPAQNDLGIMYMTGNEAKQDTSIAIFWFLKAANQGYPNAIFNLGKCTMEGVGVNKNSAHAMFLLIGAYFMGIENAIQYLIETINIDELLNLYQQDNAQAQSVLGECYAQGCQVEKSFEKSIECFEKAAKQNEPLSLLVIGRLFANGIGVEKDLLRAEYILKQAREQATKQVGELGFINIGKEIATIRDNIIDNCPYILVKVIPMCNEDNKAKDKYVTDFLDGKLFMKTLDQFGDLLKMDSSSINSFRGDTLEGLSEINPDIYLFGNIDKDGNFEKLWIHGLIDVLKLREKIFCLTAIEYNELNHCFVKPDPRMKEFGEYAIIITDVEEFLRRVRVTFNELCEKDNADYRLAYKRVKYNIDFSQPPKSKCDEFMKSEQYSWQKEFRIVIDFSEGKFSEELLNNVTDFAKHTFQSKIEKDTNPLSLADYFYLDIGNISDICVRITTDELVNLDKTQLSIIIEPNKIAPFDPQRKPRPTFCKGVVITKDDDGKYNFAFTKDTPFNNTIRMR
jgi:tetratricopeptide (TPR) repeat protein